MQQSLVAVEQANAGCGFVENGAKRFFIAGKSGFNTSIFAQNLGQFFEKPDQQNQQYRADN